MNTNNKAPYVSCIKINGKPILPPMITSELRKELQRYKHQAFKLEQRLKNCRDLKKHLDEILQAQIDTRPCSQLTFGDNSHIEALEITEKSKNRKSMHLGNDIIDVTQYNNDGVKIICCGESETIDFREGLMETSNGCDSCKIENLASDKKDSNTESAKNCKFSIEQSVVVSSNDTPSKPRLIRSNSYTLESPSPILLAHLQKTSKNKSKIDTECLASARNWASLENNIPNNIPIKSSDLSITNTMNNNARTERSGSKTENLNSPSKSSTAVEEIKSPTIEVYQTDISVQQITVNTSNSSENGKTREEKRKMFLSKDPFDAFEPNCELMNVLKDIPQTYSSQIIQLLKKQHTEQKERLERYDNLNGTPEKLCSTFDISTGENPSEKEQQEGFDSISECLNSPNGNICVTSRQKSETDCENSINLTSKSSECLTKSDSKNINNNDQVTSNSEKLRRSSTFSISPSQSLYYSITNDSDILTAPLNVDSNDREHGSQIKTQHLEQKNGYWEHIMITENAQNSNVNRELFPKIDPITLNVLRKEWAASVIGAHVKGYLIRRLLRTEKVQTLIATVKDVLVCALELHQSKNIDEKDVELHRRLINQLSAALYSFHDIFFDLPVPEQMLIIAADRQRKIEKLKRPQSGSSSVRSLSNKSSTSSKSNKSINSSRSSSKHKIISASPSLTKV